MAQTGFSVLSLYYSSTSTNVPTAGNLVAGELAINTADGKLFYKDSAGVVQVIGTKGGVGSSSTTQVLYNSSGLVVGSANLTYDGTTFTTTGAANFATSTGNVGIGTSSPAKQLQITNSTYAQMRINPNSAYAGIIEFVDSASTTNARILGWGSTNATPNALSFDTNGTERMRIDSSGNVGIGVTPSAWNTDYKALQIGNYSSLYGRVGTNETGVMNNMYRNASAQYTYLITGPAAWYYVSGSSHNWTSSASGTAGTAVTTTQVLSVDRGTTLALQGASSVVGCGVSFPATQSASSDANTLDDYEEGSWTPVPVAGTGSITSYTSSGTYIKIGRSVLITGVVTITNAGTGSNGLSIDGMPFSPTTAAYGVCRETAVTGNIYYAVYNFGSTSMVLQNATNGSVPVTTNYIYRFSGTFVTNN